ncbi:MAG: hypothetical protein ACI4F7_00040 [Acutalibacteraceae bacterium]
MTKGKKLVLGLAALSALLAVGITLAFILKKTDTVTNTLNRAVVSCETEEEFNGVSKSGITVKNTGKVSAYLRVTLVSYWADDSGNIVAIPSSVPALEYDTVNWIKSGDVYYYKSPVKPNESTPNLLTAAITLAENSTFNGVDVHQVVEVLSEAVQSDPETAVKEVWNATLDTNKTIAAVVS